MDDTQSKMPNTAVIALALALLVIVGGGMGYRYWNSDDAKNARQERRNVELARIVADLENLPKDEKPLIYEIADPATLAKSQTFFEGAQKGDMLLVFQKSGKAVVYSPSRRAIVKTGPIQSEHATSTTN